ASLLIPILLSNISRYCAALGHRETYSRRSCCSVSSLSCELQELSTCNRIMLHLCFKLMLYRIIALSNQMKAMIPIERELIREQCIFLLTKGGYITCTTLRILMTMINM